MSPLDGQIADFVKPAEVVPDLSRPSLEGLAYVLDHVEHWPAKQGKRWRWDFSVPVNKCGTAGCAMGICDAIWGRENAGLVYGFADSHAVFVEGTKDPSITPAIVAARIRDHLAGRPVRYK